MKNILILILSFLLFTTQGCSSVKASNPVIYQIGTLYEDSISTLIMNIHSNLSLFQDKTIFIRVDSPGGVLNSTLSF